MNRSTLIMVIIAVVICVSVMAAGVWGLVHFFQNGPAQIVRDNSAPGGFRVQFRQPEERPIDIIVPKVAPENSIAVFDLRPTGDKNTKLYAMSFSRALADRLYCAPTCITQQPTPNNIGDQVSVHTKAADSPVSDELARTIGNTLGVRYAVSGDFKLGGSRLEISANLVDLSTGAAKPLSKQSGFLSDLPVMQTALAQSIVSGMHLELTDAESRELSRANFSNPKTLELYGRSRMAKDVKQMKELRWQGAERDPNSSFAAIRLLEFYAYGPVGGRKLLKDSQLSRFVGTASERFPGNSHIAVLKGLILQKQFKYKSAEAVLQSVVKRDPKMARAHEALARVAMDRQDAELAVKKARALVDLWPTSAEAHCTLASAYAQAADSARHGHYYNDMNWSMERAWNSNSVGAFKEASIATKLDRNWLDAWSHILNIGRELGRYESVRKAFAEMVRITPRNRGPYIDCAFCYSPQWGGAPGQAEQILHASDKAFGEGSSDACLVRIYYALANKNSVQERENFLRLANQAIAKSKGQNLDAMHVKCRVLMGLKRWPEALEISKKGFQAWPSPTWRMNLSYGYEHRYEQTGDPNALNEVAKLLVAYVDEIPYDPRGHTQLGWCFSHQGRLADAKREFLRALELDPTNETAKEKLKYVQ